MGPWKLQELNTLFSKAMNSALINPWSAQWLFKYMFFHLKYFCDNENYNLAAINYNDNIS